MIGSFPAAFLTPRTTFVALDNTLTKDARYFLIALFNRTGAGTGLPSVGNPLSAKGTTQADALILASDWNNVSTVASNSGVAIPVLAVGADCLVWNAGANALKVYPPVGSAIDSLGPNTAYSLATGKMQWFRCLSSTIIRSTQLG